MNNARKFIGKLIIIALALTLTDQLAGRWLAHAYARISHGEQGRMNFAIDSTTAPILVLGSSRAAHHYVSSILTDSLHLSCYNAGKDNQGLFYPLAILTAIVQRYHPKLLILDLKPTAFVADHTELDNLAVLLPYYHTHPAFRPILDRRSPWESYKTFSYLYCYNSLSLQIAKQAIDDKAHDTSELGYLPKFQTIHGPYPDNFPDRLLTDTPDSVLIKTFQNIISLTRQIHCRLTVVISPVYFPLQHGSSTISAAADICRTQHITFLDYSRSLDFLNQNNLFYDGTHLNDSGARKFTRILSADLHNSE